MFEASRDLPRNRSRGNGTELRTRERGRCHSWIACLTNIGEVGGGVSRTISERRRPALRCLEGEVASAVALQADAARDSRVDVAS